METKPELASRIPVLKGLNLITRLKSPFPYYLNDDRKNILLSTAISVFVVVFMMIYKPFRSPVEDVQLSHALTFGGVTFITLVISIIIMPKLFPVVFDPIAWTLGKYLSQTILQCIAIGIIAVFIDMYVFTPEKSALEVIPHAFSQVGLIGIIPVVIITLLLKNNMLLENLRQAVITNQELEKIRNRKSDAVRPSANTITIFSDTSETLSLNLPDLLFIEADDNYSTVYWSENESVSKKLLRANLKSIENQIDNSFTIRCHRSYMVNVHAISSVTGNTNGYKLRIRDTEHYIPVSRPKGKEVMEKIRQLKNMMDLY